MIPMTKFREAFIKRFDFTLFANTGQKDEELRRLPAAGTSAQKSSVRKNSFVVCRCATIHHHKPTTHLIRSFIPSDP
jgi:hypothetical protein